MNDDEDIMGSWEVDFQPCGSKLGKVFTQSHTMVYVNRLGRLRLASLLRLAQAFDSISSVLALYPMTLYYIKFNSRVSVSKILIISFFFFFFF